MSMGPGPMLFSRSRRVFHTIPQPFYFWGEIPSPVNLYVLRSITLLIYLYVFNIYIFYSALSGSGRPVHFVFTTFLQLRLGSPRLSY